MVWMDSRKGVALGTTSIKSQILLVEVSIGIWICLKLYSIWLLPNRKPTLLGHSLTDSWTFGGNPFNMLGTWSMPMTLLLAPVSTMASPWEWARSECAVLDKHSKTSLVGLLNWMGFGVLGVKRAFQKSWSFERHPSFLILSAKHAMATWCVLLLLLSIMSPGVWLSVLINAVSEKGTDDGCMTCTSMHFRSSATTSRPGGAMSSTMTWAFSKSSKLSHGNSSRVEKAFNCWATLADSLAIVCAWGHSAFQCPRSPQSLQVERLIRCSRLLFPDWPLR